MELGRRDAEVKHSTVFGAAGLGRGCGFPPGVSERTAPCAEERSENRNSRRFQRTGEGRGTAFILTEDTSTTLNW